MTKDPTDSSYRFPIVSIGLSLTIFAVLRMFQTDRGWTDRRNWSSKRRHYAVKCIGRQKHQVLFLNIIITCCSAQPNRFVILITIVTATLPVRIVWS